MPITSQTSSKRQSVFDNRSINIPKTSLLAHMETLEIIHDEENEDEEDEKPMKVIVPALIPQVKKKPILSLKI